VFAAQALGEHEGVLGADRHDQPRCHQKSVDIALPDRIHAARLVRFLLASLGIGKL